jgi:hypothetical protein
MGNEHIPTIPNAIGNDKQVYMVDTTHPRMENDRLVVDEYVIMNQASTKSPTGTPSLFPLGAQDVKKRPCGR